MKFEERSERPTLRNVLKREKYEILALKKCLNLIERTQSFVKIVQKRLLQNVHIYFNPIL